MSSLKYNCYYDQNYRLTIKSDGRKFHYRNVVGYSFGIPLRMDGNVPGGDSGASREDSEGTKNNSELQRLALSIIPTMSCRDHPCTWYQGTTAQRRLACRETGDDSSLNKMKWIMT